MPASIFNGIYVKTLRSFLNLNDVAYVINGTADPTITATSAPRGSIYLKTDDGAIYEKTDNGSSTNWLRLLTTNDLTNLATFSNSTFSGTTVTATSARIQRHAYTGSSAQTLATFNFSSAPDGAIITILSRSSSDNSLTIPTGLTNVRQNGDLVLYQDSSVQYIIDGTEAYQLGM